MSLPDYRLDPPEVHAIQCPTCGGSGKEEAEACAVCSLPESEHAAVKATCWTPMKQDCSPCEGTGEVALSSDDDEPEEERD